jgi:hypothetical protein
MSYPVPRSAKPGFAFFDVARSKFLIVDIYASLYDHASSAQVEHVTAR